MDLQGIKNKFGIIGNDAQLNHALKVATQVAATDLSVLINGESGVGKEVFSKIIHELSPRKHNNFIAVNCGAIPEGTIDSELFGHEKGSFTSATDQRKGYFETVNGGTIFLDEIGELPLNTQARLLRVLETGEYIRVGSSKVLKTDVRVVAATNKDLLELTQKDKFREDLYYRLNSVPIKVPPLRERKEDINLLFRKFTGDFADKYKSKSIQLTADAQQLLKEYPFPGNVRELKNIAEQISVLAQQPTIDAEQLKQFLPQSHYAINRLPARLEPTEQNVIPSYSDKNDQYGHSSEREILYKILFDMKKDVTDLKQMMLQLLHTSSNTDFFPNQYPNTPPPATTTPSNYRDATNPGPAFGALVLGDNSYPSKKEVEDVEEIEEEESLSLVDKERELIVKALIKHQGKRKDAALELGISERTLYRKIKEYNIKE